MVIVRLGELLISDNQVGPDQLAEALRRQVLHGGRLGTNLVELQHLTLEELAQALGRQHHMPAATGAHFGQLDKLLLEKLTPAMAYHWHAIPLGRTGPNASVVAIATPDPLSPELKDNLETVLGTTIVQAICPELRMLYWLEAAYNIERPNRFKRAPSREEQKSGSFDERRAYIQTLADTPGQPEGSGQPKAPEQAEGPGQLGRVAVRRVAVQRSDIAQVPIAMLDFDEAIRVIRLSNGRRRLADQVIELLEHSFDNCLSAAMLLTLRQDLAVGWNGFRREGESLCVDDLALPLEESSLFGPAVESGLSSCGTTSEITPDPTLVDQRYWQCLGKCPPTFLATYPIVVMKETVALLYVQSDTEISLTIGSSLDTLVATISTALTRLIRSANR